MSTVHPIHRRPGFTVHPIVLVVLAVFLFAAIGSARAQKRPMFDAEGDLLLSAQVIATSTIVRPGYPTPLQVPLIWRGKRLLQGRLHYAFYVYDPDDPVLTMISPELTLNDVPRELDCMLPAIEGIADQTDTLFAHLTFEEAGNPEPFDLETHSLRVGFGPHRQMLPYARARNLSAPTPYGYDISNFAIAVVHSRFGDNFVSAVSERTWWTDYQPGIHSRESFLRIVDEATQRGGSRTSYHPYSPPVTYPAFLPPTDLPATLPGLEGYDAVFLQEGVKELSVRQRDALADWVNVGGRILLQRRGDAADTTAIAEFLQRCGCKRLESPAPPGMEILGANLGHVLVLPAGYTPARIVSQPIPEARVREYASARQRRFRSDAGPVVPDSFHSDLHAQAVHRFWNPTVDITPAVSADAAELLAPRGLETLPVKAILACIGLFLLAAAPLDYYYLGILRQRNLTWVIYPVAALTCSWLVVLATNSRITGDVNGSWDIVIVGNDNTPLEQQSFQLLLHRQHSTIAFAGTQVFQAITGLPGDYAFSGYGDDNARIEGWTITGTYPGHYRSSARLAQWTPAIQKTVRYFPELEVPEVPWTEIDPWPLIETTDAEANDAESYPERVITMAAPLAAAASGSQVHATSMFRGTSHSASTPAADATAVRTATYFGEPIDPAAFCIPCSRLTTDLACAAFTLQDGNRFTTYVRLFPRPAGTQP